MVCLWMQPKSSTVSKPHKDVFGLSASCSAPRLFSVRNAEGSMSIQLSGAIHMESRYSNIYAMIRHVINTDETVSPSEHDEELYGTRVTPIHWPFSPTLSLTTFRSTQRPRLAPPRAVPVSQSNGSTHSPTTVCVEHLDSQRHYPSSSFPIGAIANGISC